MSRALILAITWITFNLVARGDQSFERVFGVTLADQKSEMTMTVPAGRRWSNS